LIEECNRPCLFISGTPNHEDDDVLRSDALVRSEDLTTPDVGDLSPLQVGIRTCAFEERIAGFS